MFQQHHLVKQQLNHQQLLQQQQQNCGGNNFPIVDANNGTVPHQQHIPSSHFIPHPSSQIQQQHLTPTNQQRFN